MDTRKKVTRTAPGYHPADAVRADGDLWRYSKHVNVDIKTSIALSDQTQDRQDASIMRMCERGEIERCPL